MLTDCGNAIVDIVGVEHMKWSGGTFRVDARDYSALALRIKGTGTITAGGMECRVDEHDVLYIPQGCSYTADYSDTEILAVHFRTAADDALPQVFSVPDTEQLCRTFLTAYTFWQDKTPGRMAFALSKLYDILGQINEQKAENRMPEALARAVSYINAHFRCPDMTVPEVCRRAGVGATCLRSWFRQFYGKRPTQYITDLRLEYARNLISGGMSVKEAALESGFHDPKCFARVVKDRFRCAPRELQLYGK